MSPKPVAMAPGATPEGRRRGTQPPSPPEEQVNVALKC